MNNEQKQSLIIMYNYALEDSANFKNDYENGTMNGIRLAIEVLGYKIKFENQYAVDIVKDNTI